MQVSVESTGELGRRLKVEVPAGRIDDQVERRIKEMGRQVKLKGFRPGKVPMHVLQQRFGKQVREDVVNDVLRESFQEAVNQEKLRPAGTPEITAEGRKPGEKLSYTASFEVYPELEDLRIGDLEIERPDVEVGDTDVDAMIETLQRQRREWEQVERGAADGDLVVIQYYAEADGARHPPEGTERAGTVLGSNSLFADLERSLEGAAKGDEKTVDIQFPSDFRDASLAGKAGQVSFKVVSVSEGRMPEVDEEFVRSFGVQSGNVEDFRAEVKRNLDRELHQAVMERLRVQVVDGLVKLHSDVTIPESLVAEEAENLRRQQTGGREGQDAPPAQAFMDKARRRVTAGFLLSEVARQNGIQADSARVRDKIAEIAATYEQPEQVVEAYRSDPRLLESVRNMVLEEQVVEWVVEHAKVSDKPASFDELMRPSEQQQEAKA